MNYPVQAADEVAVNAAVSVPFRPTAAGLVNVIVNAVGLPPPPGDGSNGGTTMKQPNGGGAQHPQKFRSFTVAVRLDIFKPGVATPAATGFQHVDVTSPFSRNRVVFAVSAAATGADLGADWSARLTNAPADFAARYETASARYQVTVRYQVVPGNLGKVDHIVVLMMENRSFDHMLGYLSLPAAKGGRARSEVDGLTGNEYNYGSATTSRTVYPVKPRQDTFFRTDPGHEWSDVEQQLSGDASDPALPTNAGFVINFAQRIANIVKDLPPRRHSVSDQAQIDEGSSHAIAFRPALPGTIIVEAKTQGAPSQSESGKLGSVALSRPGSTAELIHVNTPIGGDTLGLTYPASKAVLDAAVGDWTCRITNGTGTSLNFNTTISYVQEAHDPSSQETADAVMSYYTAEQVPVYDLLAGSFAICDRWYSSLPTDTWPNRLYAITGGSGGLDTTPTDTSTEQDPPGYLLRTIYEVLQEHQVSWNIFFSDLPFALIFTRLVQDATYTARMRSIDEFVQRAETGDLPSLCWIDPNFQDVPDGSDATSDDHPPGDVCRGQNLIGRIYAALINSPAWAKTLLIITYDEHGGFYDHVHPPADVTIGPPKPVATAHAVEPAELLSHPDVGPGQPAPQPVVENTEPPPPVTHPAVTAETARPVADAAAAVHIGHLPIGGGPPDDNPRFHRYGLRVPALVVSPWVMKGSVSKQVYDHTSLLSTILHRFCLQPDDSVPSMGQRADHALDLDSMLSADTPNLSPKKGPDASNCQAAAQVNVIHRNASFGEVLRKSLLRF